MNHENERETRQVDIQELMFPLVTFTFWLPIIFSGLDELEVSSRTSEMRALWFSDALYLQDNYQVETLEVSTAASHTLDHAHNVVSACSCM